MMLLQILCTPPLLVIKPIGQHKRRHQTPPINRIAHPRTDDLRPAGPICATHRHKVRHSLLIKIASKQRRHPRRRQEEDDVEKRVVVLGSVALVVAGGFGGRVIFIFAVRVVEGGGWKRAGFDGGAERGLAHIAARLGLLGYEAVLVVFGTHLRVAIAVAVALRAEGKAVCCGAGGRVCDGDKGYYGADDDGGLAGAACADEWVALVVVGLHAHSGECQVGAVDGYDGGLGKACAGVDVLNSRVDRYDGCDEEEKKVDLSMSVTGLTSKAEMHTVMAAWFMPHPLLAK